MVIIETADDLATFREVIRSHSILIIPIFVDPKIHPVATTISFYYVRMDDGRSFVLPLDHPDVDRLIEGVDALVFADARRIYTPFATAIRHSLSLAPLDMVGLEWVCTGRTRPVDEFYTTVQRHIYAAYDTRPNLNRVVPFMQLIAHCEALADHYSRVAGDFADDPRTTNPAFRFHNDVVLPAIQFMEAPGIHVDRATFLEHFGDRLGHHLRDDYIFSRYNPHTSTGRVTGTFAAVNKSNGSRKAFDSRFPNGRMVLIDFESFHLRLIAELIGYNLPAEPVHEYLGRQYFNVEQLTPEQYDGGKQLTFRYLYSTSREGAHIPFFERVYSYVDLLWNLADANGYIETSEGNILHLARIENPNPGKLFNYLLQLREMEVTMSAVNRLRDVFDKLQSVVVLYTYDSLLIDFNKADGIHALREIMSVLEADGKYPVRVYLGPDYGTLENITKILR